MSITKPLRVKKPSKALKPSLSRLLEFRIGNKGQATIEYLVVALALLVVIIALSALSGRIQEGLFIEHAIDSASHAFGKNTMGAIGDVLLF